MEWVHRGLKLVLGIQPLAFVFCPTQMLDNKSHHPCDGILPSEPFSSGGSMTSALNTKLGNP